MEEGGSSGVYRGSLDRLIDKVNDARGIDLSLYRRAYVERRITTRLRALDLHSFRQYADVLESDPNEYERLLDTLTINVTEFFRDQVVWDSIKRNVMRPMLESKSEGRSRTIRLWSAACATGEEPYSLAMMLLDAVGKDESRYLMSVLATDLDREALRRAELGVFDNQRLRHIPASYQVRFTQPVNREAFEMDPSVRKIVRFREASLFDPAPQRSIDLIMCRNVFIYFDREQQARALETFWGALARGGYLVLGRSEKLSPQAAERFEPIDGRERIYRKPVRY